MTTPIKVKSKEDIPRKVYLFSLREAYWLWLDVSAMIVGALYHKPWLVLWTIPFAVYELWRVQRKADEIIKIVKDQALKEEGK